MRPLALVLHALLQSRSPAPADDPSTRFWQRKGSAPDVVRSGRREPLGPGGTHPSFLHGTSYPSALLSGVESRSQRGHGYEFDNPAYWDELYTRDPDPYDWFMDYPTIREYIQNATKGDLNARILHVACGNSELPELMYQEGYRNIVNIDISAVVIHYMAQRNLDKEGLTWRVMDSTRMAFDDAEFDVVIDKSLIDTLCCHENSSEMKAAYLSEVARVLRFGGGFVCFTLAYPSYMRPLIERTLSPSEFLEWSVPVSPRSLGEGHAYVARK